MTEYGLRVINSASEIQIDSIYKNFSFLQAGSKALTGGENTYSLTSVTAFPPLTAIRPSTSGFSVVERLVKSGSNYSSIIISGEESISQTVNVAVFGGGSSTTLPDYGLVVYNESEEIVFNSGEKYLKIIGTTEFTIPDPYATGGDDYTDITVQDADENFFILAPFNRLWTNVTYSPFDLGEWSSGIKKISSAVIRAGNFVVESPVSSSVDGQPWGVNHVLIEVSY